jgi:hypothetical protein
MKWFLLKAERKSFGKDMVLVWDRHKEWNLVVIGLFPLIWG